jgi:Protein of unknown function (DUF3102)
MSKELAARKGSTKLSAEEAAELGAITGRVRDRLRRTAADLLFVGADLIRAKAMLGHGRFGPWLDDEFSLSRRSAEQFMAAARRFGARNEVVSHLPAGAVLELSAPSVPDELVERVLTGEVPASVSAIRAERATERSEERSVVLGGTFIDYLMRFDGTSDDFAAGIAAHVLRRWRKPEHRAWFAGCVRIAAAMIEENLEAKIAVLELPRTTARRLKELRRG